MSLVAAAPVRWRPNQQSLVFIDERLIIRASRFLETGSIADADVSAVVLDQAAIFERLGRLAHRGPTHSEYAREALLGVWQVVSDCAVAGQQEPLGQPLLWRVRHVA